MRGESPKSYLRVTRGRSDLLRSSCRRLRPYLKFSVGRLILYRDDRSLVFGETYLLCIYFMQLFLIQVFVIIIFDWIKWSPWNAFWKSNYISYWMLQHIHHTNTNKSRKNNTFVDISYTEEFRIWPKSPVRWPQQVRSATRDSQVGLRAFAPHDLYLLPGSNHGPCRTWLGLGGGR